MSTTSDTRYHKAGVVCDCDIHIVLAVAAARGSGPVIKHIKRVLTVAFRRMSIETLLANADYKGEESRIFAHEILGIRSIIPAKIGRRNKVGSAVRTTMVS